MEKLSPHSQYTKWARVEADPSVNSHISGFSSDPASVRISPAKLNKLLGIVATLSLMVVAFASPGHAQAPTLGAVAPFAVLAGSAVTNTGPTTLEGTAALPGNAGVFPGCSMTGFGSVTFATGGVQHPCDAVAKQAQVALLNAYNNLAGRPTSVDLTGHDLGGRVLVPGVYNFSTAAQLTGVLTLNGLGNPNAVFIFKIGSTLTTASASAIQLINKAQGGNVFWQVGSSATLGTGTSFTGDILAHTSITLDTAAKITCGAAWANTGAVTLDTNTISLCDVTHGSGGTPLGPTGFPLFVALLPPSATTNQISVATGLDNAVAGGATLPLGFLNLFNLSPSALASALTELSGEVATAVAPAGIQAMNSFLLLVSSPFGNNRVFTPPPQPRILEKSLVFEADPEPSRWGIWTAGYGGQTNVNGNSVVGSSNRSETAFAGVIGFDYRITPYTQVGLALAGGGTNYGLSDGLGGGHGDMFQSAVYSLTRIDAAYLSATVAYAWQHQSTNRSLTLTGTDQLTAGFSTNDIGGRIEGGYRFALPEMPALGFIPYAAAQMQAFFTPSYNESAASGSSQFALAYNAQTTPAGRTELGAWFDDNIALGNGAILSLLSRAAWAYDFWSKYSITAAFQQLPGSTFTVLGAAPTRNSLLASGGAQISFGNGFSLAGLFDTNLNADWRTYTGYLQMRYAW